MLENEVTARQVNQLYNFGSTYKTDYRHGNVYEQVNTTYKPKTPAQPKEFPPLKYVQSISHWRDRKPVPFTLLHRPKEIIRTSPTDVQAPFEKPVDADLEKARKTRPRLLLPMNISMDDIEDAEARAIICDYMYTSSLSKATQDAVSPYHTIKTPLPCYLTSSNIISFKPYRPAAVPSEWKMESVGWDNKQLRSFVDANSEFWKRKQLL